MPSNSIDLVGLLELPNERFLPAAFRALTGREPDVIGLVHYAKRLQSRLPRVLILAELRSSSEGKSHAANAISPELDKLVARYLLVRNLPAGRKRWSLLPKIKAKIPSDKDFNWVEWANSVGTLPQRDGAHNQFQSEHGERRSLKTFIKICESTTKRTPHPGNGAGNVFLIPFLYDLYNASRFNCSFVEFLQENYFKAAGCEIGALLEKIIRLDVSVDPDNEQLAIFKCKYNNYSIAFGDNSDEDFLNYISKNIDNYIALNNCIYMDRKFYANLIKNNTIDEVYHYLRYGAQELRSTSPAFDSRVYLEQYQDIRALGLNPLVHHAKFGAKEGRQLSKSISIDAIKVLQNPLNSSSVGKVDILIPVFNGFEILVRLINSIERHTAGDFRLLIGDDCSVDERIWPYLRELVDSVDFEVHCIRNSRNLGFIKTINKLAGYARSHFIILNSDTIVTAGWLDKMVQPILDNPHIASVTPFTNAGTICSFPTFMTDSPLPEVDLDQYAEAFTLFSYLLEIPTAVGFCMAINYSVYSAIGFFDEIYGLGYGEENDWCQRARMYGYKHVIQCSCIVYHDHGGSFSSEQKQNLLKRNTKILTDRYPLYMQSVEKFVNADPLDNVRRLISARLATKLGATAIVLEHGFGGGTNHYTNLIEPNYGLFIVVRPRHGGGYSAHLKVHGDDHLVIYSMTSLHALLSTLLDCFRVGRLIINSVAGVHDLKEVIADLVKIRSSYNIVLRYMHHDYYSLCPSYTLLNGDEKFCGLPSRRACDSCFASNHHVEHGLHLVSLRVDQVKNAHRWRNMFSPLLRIADEVVVFSEAAQSLVKKVYPNKLLLEPHKVDYITKAHPVHHDNVFNIGIFGNITIAKGLRVIERMLFDVERDDLPIRFHVFGDYRGNGNDNIISFNGLYKHSQIPMLIEKHELNAIFVSSIWPETFCYVAEEAMKTEIPVICFDVGAQAERIKKYCYGLVLPSLESSARDLFTLLQPIDEKWKAEQVADDNLIVRQIYYKEEQREHISEEAIPYFNSAVDISSNLHENSVFIKEGRNMPDNAVCGYVSWKFEAKTGVSVKDIKTIFSANKGYDFYYINPFFELPLLYKNVWEQGEEYHSGITALADRLFSAANLNFDLGVPMGPDDTLYSNYWFASGKYFAEYAALIEKVLLAIKRLPASEANAYFRSSGYHTGANALTFILERLFSTAKVNNYFASAKYFPILYSEDMKLSWIRKMRVRVGE